MDNPPERVGAEEGERSKDAAMNASSAGENESGSANDNMAKAARESCLNEQNFVSAGFAECQPCQRVAMANNESSGDKTREDPRDRPEQYECPFAGCGRLFPSLDFLLFHWPVHRLEDMVEDEEVAEVSGRAACAGPSGDCLLSGLGMRSEGGEARVHGGSAAENFFLFGLGAKRKHDHSDTIDHIGNKPLRPLLPNNITPPPRRFTIPPALAPPPPLPSSPPPSPTPPPRNQNPLSENKPESPPSQGPIPNATGPPPLLGLPLVGGSAFPVPEQLKNRALQASRWLPLSTQPVLCRECLAASPSCGSGCHGAGSAGPAAPVAAAAAVQPASEQSQPPEVWNPPLEEEPHASKAESSGALPPPDKLLREFMEFAELRQYVSLLEDEWVTMSELPKLSDNELVTLGLPIGACKKLRRALLRFERER